MCTNPMQHNGPTYTHANVTQTIDSLRYACLFAGAIKLYITSTCEMVSGYLSSPPQLGTWLIGSEEPLPRCVAAFAFSEDGDGGLAEGT